MMNQTSPPPHRAHLVNSRRPLPPVAIAKGDHDRLTAIASSAADTAADFVAYLCRELNRARIVEDEVTLDDVICMGDIVTYRDEATHATHTVQLVYPEEADLAAGRLSVLSSIGVALIGLRRNSSIEWFTPSGHPRLLTILDVSKGADQGGLAGAPSPNDAWIVRIYADAKALGLSGHDAFVRCLREVHRLEADQTDDQLRTRIERALHAYYQSDPEES